MSRRGPKTPPLGFSPTQATASGAGTHGKAGRRRRKAERAKVRRALKNYDRKDD